MTTQECVQPVAFMTSVTNACELNLFEFATSIILIASQADGLPLMLVNGVPSVSVRPALELTSVACRIVELQNKGGADSYFIMTVQGYPTDYFAMG